MVLLPLVPFWLYLAHFKSLAFSDFVACFFFYVMFMYNLRLKGSIKELQISVYGAILFTIWQRHCHSNQQKWTSSTVYACGLQMFTDQEYPIGFLQQPIRENSKALNTRIYVIGKGFQIKCISLDAALQRCRSFWWFSQIKKSSLKLRWAKIRHFPVHWKDKIQMIPGNACAVLFKEVRPLYSYDWMMSFLFLTVNSHSVKLLFFLRLEFVRVSQSRRTGGELQNKIPCVTNLLDPLCQWGR